MDKESSGGHRLIGAGLVALGLAVLCAEAGLLYGSQDQRDLMVAIGLPGVAILSVLAAICFGFGCILAAAPRATAHHLRRISRALRRQN